MSIKVLIVDDSLEDRVYFSKLLEKSGASEYIVFEADSSTKAVETCAAIQPDCLLLDYSMPGVSGIDFLRELEATQTHRACPVIMLTGQGNETVAVDALKLGAHDYLVKSQLTSTVLIHAISNAIERSQLLETISEQNKALKYLAHHDSLTELGNRVAFEEHAGRMLAHASRHDRFFALLFIDLDNFKNVNDTLGHAVGDKLLKKIATDIKKCARKDDFISRVGGDEFAIALNEIRDDYDAGIVAEKILEAINHSYKLNGNEVRISASIGVVCYPRVKGNLTDLLKYADIAMYRAKEAGRHNYQFYSKGLNEKYKKRLQVQTLLLSAVRENHFNLIYQPRYELKTNRVVGIEAHLQWDDPKLGDMSSEEFMPIAEEAGLIFQITEWILKNAIHDYNEYNLFDYGDICLSLNLSPAQLLSEKFDQTIKRILIENNFDPKRLSLQITEKLTVLDQQKSREFFSNLNNLGASIILDRFGAGYSSLNCFKFLPITKLKVDSEFIKNINLSEYDQLIMKSILAFSKTMNIDLIAVGVSNKEQKEFLIENDCKYVQGDYFCSAIEIENLNKLIKK